LGISTALAPFNAGWRCVDEGVPEDLADLQGVNGGYSLIIEFMDFILWTVSAIAVYKDATAMRAMEKDDTIKIRRLELTGSFMEGKCFQFMLWIIGISALGIIVTGSAKGLKRSDESGRYELGTACLAIFGTCLIIMAAVSYLTGWFWEHFFQYIFADGIRGGRGAPSPTALDKARVRYYTMRTFVLDFGTMLVQFVNGYPLPALKYNMWDGSLQIRHLTQSRNKNRKTCDDGTSLPVASTIAGVNV